MKNILNLISILVLSTYSLSQALQEVTIMSNGIYLLKMHVDGNELIRKVIKE